MKRLGKSKSLFLVYLIGLLVYSTSIFCCAEGNTEKTKIEIETEKTEADKVPIYGKDIKDGSYSVEVESSSSMFRIVKAELKVLNGEMTAVLTLSGTGYLQLFMGTGEEALKAEEGDYIPYVEDSQGAYTYTIPVVALNQEFECAAYSSKKKQWYDRQLVVLSSSIPEDALQITSEDIQQEPAEIQAEDGVYTMELTLSGGSGRASVTSPARIQVSEKTATAFLEWSSSNFDYMIVNGTKYLPVNKEGNSVFGIPILVLDQEMDVIVDTVAMSKPHEIAYTLTFHSDTMQKEKKNVPIWVIITVTLVMAAGLVIAGKRFFDKKRGCKMWKKKKVQIIWFLFFFMVFVLGGCRNTVIQNESTANSELENRDTNISSQISYIESMKLQYAEKFAVDYYQEDYILISVADGRQYLIVPEGKEQPEDLREGIVVLNRPFQNIYLVATAVMDMFCKLDALDSIRFSGQKTDGWSMTEVQEQMENGNILYAGKYNMPDYELILSENCSLAIENNMISHAPEVVEKLESFGIPVWIDFSSYERHPLGRVEWIRLYGVLMQKEEAAEHVFDMQAKMLEQVVQKETSGKSVAFFFITANGTANVRVSSDYIPKMIELAGGNYIFEQLGKEDSSRSSITMQMEEFYHTAKDADYLIYNSTIDGELASLEELLQKEELLKDFKAVQEGNVWCTTKDLYQQSMSIGQMIKEMHQMLSGDTDIEKEMIYFYQLQ